MVTKLLHLLIAQLSLFDFTRTFAFYKFAIYEHSLSVCILKATIF